MSKIPPFFTKIGNNSQWLYTTLSPPTIPTDTRSLANKTLSLPTTSHTIGHLSTKSPSPHRRPPLTASATRSPWTGSCSRSRSSLDSGVPGADIRAARHVGKSGAHGWVRAAGGEHGVEGMSRTVISGFKPELIPNPDLPRVSERVRCVGLVVRIGPCLDSAPPSAHGFRVEAATMEVAEVWAVYTLQLYLP